MFKTLEIRQYRGFKSFNLSGLKRVNLLVGKNNCGKTSILEALEFLISKGNPSVLVTPTVRRGENNFANEESTSYSRNTSDISHLFFGRRLEPGASFSISSDGGTEQLSVELFGSPEEAENDSGNSATEYGQQRFSLIEEDSEEIPIAWLRIAGSVPNGVPLFPVTENGSISLSRLRQMQRIWSDNVSRISQTRFLTPESFQPSSMRDMWDRALSESREVEVIEAMKLLQNDIVSINFLTSGAYRNSPGGVLVGLRGNTRRLPLGSFGDGMRRLLALSLSLVRTAGGFLLIDEIDTGLHFSVMEQMWNLVVETARRSNVQVFATTHSYDCIQGFASLLKTSSDFVSEVSVQKIDSSLDNAISLDADQIELAVRQGIEVR